jgi:EAL domain-containing protein (putative c-di-GMP-specific phosphodiesterase class I)
LLPSINRRVFGKAIDRLKQKRPLLEGDRISINLAGPTLFENSFLEFILKLFTVNGMCTDTVIIEITGSSALSDLFCGQRFLTPFSEIGCQFVLDDFGKGFSLLGSPKHLSMDYIKMEEGLVRDRLTDPFDDAMRKLSLLNLLKMMTFRRN